MWSLRLSSRTKATDISAKVRKQVNERDNGCCVLCGTPHNLQVAHYISRSNGGLGIVENLVLLCIKCHKDYDQSTSRERIRNYLHVYLSRYYDMENTNLIYRKHQ